MKTPIIITTAAAALVCAGTIAIAVDQVKTRDKELADVYGKLGVVKKELITTTKKRDEYQKQSLEWLGKWTDQAQSTLNLIEAQKRVTAATKAVEDAKAMVAQSEVRVVTFPQPVSNSYATTSYATPPPPVIPAWSPPAPSVVTKTIRDRAVAEHKDNYSSLNYEIERQTEAFEKIVRYYKTADPFIKAAINKAALEYGANYSSFAYDVERQIEARQKFNGR